MVGAALARELAQYELACMLIEAGDDVGIGTSKANTAILHTGFDATPGTLEAALVRRGHALLLEHGPRLGIPIERTGAPRAHIPAVVEGWRPPVTRSAGTLTGVIDRHSPAE